MALKHLSDPDFAFFIKDGVAVVDFWASWCGPCMAFGPIFEKAVEEYPEIAFGKFEINEANRQTPAKYGVRSIPTVVAFKNGEVVGTKVGLMDEGMFNNWLKELI